MSPGFGLCPWPKNNFHRSKLKHFIYSEQEFMYVFDTAKSNRCLNYLLNKEVLFNYKSYTKYAMFSDPHRR